MKKTYKNETLYLQAEQPFKNLWGYTVEELRWINQMRNELIAAGHDPEIICKDIDEFIEDGWFYSRNPIYKFVP